MSEKEITYNGPVLNGSSQYRKTLPIATGVLDYFPAALAEVARLSRAGNEKHNPGQPLHHARGKSSDHADCILRHLTDRGHIDPEDGILHDVKVAWRALALLQEELERRGAPLARGARLPDNAAALAAVVERQERVIATMKRDHQYGGGGALDQACEWPACPECAGPSATDDCDVSDATGVPCE